MKEYIPQLIASAIVILSLPILRFTLNKLITKYTQFLHKSEARILQVKHLIYILLNITVVCMLIIIWGVDPRNLLVGLSSAFAVIGVAMFAQWSLLSNITAGIVMFFSAPYRVGSRIHIIDKDMPIKAVIENITAFYTYIRTDEDELVVLPNNLFLQKIVSVKATE